ncbi:MAG: exodeoxyribonuclease VII small subunit [Coriobacteriia bacterium]
MADESYSFTTARTRLEDIVVQVRKKDTSLEKSLDLLEEGVRLANACTEMIDQADWAAAEAAPESVGVDAEGAAAESSGAAADATIGAGDATSAVDDSGDVLGDADADDGEPAEELAADDDPSADER